MKKALIVTLILFGLCFGLIAENIESDLYFKSFPITRVYPSRQGYRITYLKGDLTYHTFYVPMEWLTRGAAETDGEVVYGEGRTFPYFSVFWKDVKCDYIKLYLHRSQLHESWGDFPDGDYTEKFNITEPQLEF